MAKVDDDFNQEEEKKTRDISQNTTDDWNSIQKDNEKYPSPLYEEATQGIVLAPIAGD